MALLQEIQVPLLSVNDTTLTVVELLFATGQKVGKGVPVMVLETSKTTYDVESGSDGYIQYLCEPDRDYAVNDIIARIYSEEAEAMTTVARPDRTAAAAATRTAPDSPARRTVAATKHEAVTVAWTGETLFSAEAIGLIEESGVARSAFAGIDLITSTDVRAFLEKSAQPAGTVSAPRAAAPGIVPANVVLEKLRSAKRREIEYLADIQSTGLTSTVNIHVETEGIFTHINPSLQYLKDSLLPVLVYESARLLSVYPLLNAFFTGEGVAVYKEVNPGFAIDIDKGLKVLKIDGAGQKSLGNIETDILQLSGAYLDDTLTIEQLTDITFTITDLSAEGVAFFRPLINKMNSAILGLSAIDAKLERCTLSLTFDHRVTEGKMAAGFLRELKERLESYRPAGIPIRQEISCFKCYKLLKEDLGGTGFVRCITPEGMDGYICQSCLKGF
jgi:pyruvate/2-oxoglutarate dehydrogenase complex dihydrolipoamide acyltransferase (E2) component